MQKSVLICINRRRNPDQPSCAARGSEALAIAIEKEIAARCLPSLQVERVFCLGVCEKGPNLRLTPGGPFMHHLKPENLEEAMQKIEAFSAL